MNNSLRIFLSILFLVLLGSCASAPGQGETTLPTVTGPAPTPVESPSIPAPVLSFLGQDYGLKPDQIRLEEIETVEWPDACLGVVRPGEGCAQVLTPGKRLILNTPQGEFVIHSDQSGRSFRLASAPSGIRGSVTIGPVCPVAVEGTECPDQPFQTTIAVTDQERKQVTQIQTDAEGRFQIYLKPGRYLLQPETFEPFPITSPQEVVVPAGEIIQVHIRYDSGIR